VLRKIKITTLVRLISWVAGLKKGALGGASNEGMDGAGSSDEDESDDDIPLARYAAGPALRTELDSGEEESDVDMDFDNGDSGGDDSDAELEPVLPAAVWSHIG
jgi:hypothetical protein